MPDTLTPKELDDLRAIDTPTICNAIETFNARGRVDGFLGMNIRCLLPELGTLLGYAVTATVDSTSADTPPDADAWSKWMHSMQAAPKPAVIVFQDIGPHPNKSAHIGEVMGTIAKRMGGVGIVTDGGIRDILELKRLGFHCYGPGMVPSHGNPRLIDFDCTVSIDNVQIHSGDLLHGDINGVTLIPKTIASEVILAAAKIRSIEMELIAYINASAFTIEGLSQRRIAH